MKAPQIAERLARSLEKDATHLDRTAAKFQALCRRAGVDPADVLALVSDEIRAQVTR